MRRVLNYFSLLGEVAALASEAKYKARIAETPEEVVAYLHAYKTLCGLANLCEDVRRMESHSDHLKKKFNTNNLEICVNKGYEVLFCRIAECRVRIRDDAYLN